MHRSRWVRRRGQGAMLLGTLLLALTLGPVHPAAAVSSDGAGVLSSTEEARLRSFWTANGVPADVQGQLIGDLLAGEMWDVFSGTEPVSSRTTRTLTEQRTIDTYPDGSISVTTIETPPRGASGRVTPQAVSDCRSVVSGTGYVNYYDCKAFSETGVVGIGFYISYSILSGYDQIIAVNSAYGAAAFGTLSPNPPSLSLVKKTETSSGSAWAKASATYVVSGGTSSSYVEMRALVGRNTAWTRWESGLT